MKSALSNRGFTLAELLVSVGIGGIVLATLTVGSVALQRGFSAAEYQVQCQEDQMRVLDYITRDLRRATAAVVSNQNRKLTLTLPRQPASGTALPVPTLTGGIVRYGNVPMTVEYYIEGTSFLRKVNATATTVSREIEEFFVFDDEAPLVRVQLSFVPRFARSPAGAGRAATTVRAVVALRNTEGGIQ